MIPGGEEEGCSLQKPESKRVNFNRLQHDGRLGAQGGHEDMFKHAY